MRKELKYKIRRLIKETLLVYIPGTMIFAGMFILGFFSAY